MQDNKNKVWIVVNDFACGERECFSSKEKAMVRLFEIYSEYLDGNLDGLDKVSIADDISDLLIGGCIDNVCWSFEMDVK